MTSRRRCRSLADGVPAFQPNPASAWPFDRAGARVWPGPGRRGPRDVAREQGLPMPAALFPESPSSSPSPGSASTRRVVGGKGREAAQRTPCGRRAGVCSLVAATGRRRGGLPPPSPSPRAERRGSCSCLQGGRRRAGQGEVGEHAASEPTVGVAAGQEQRAQQSGGLRRAAGGEVLAGGEQDAQGVPVAALGAVSRVVWTLTRGGQRLLRWRRLRWRRLRRQR
jgi:hypothetical protein